MGRPWWYDSYWQKDRKPSRGLQLPKRPFWAWAAVVLLSLLLMAARTGFHPAAIIWFLSFVSSFCRILAIVVFLRAILSWFMVSRYNLFMLLLDDIANPILSLLRRVVPRLGTFDITPIIALAILYFIPFIFSLILR